MIKEPLHLPAAAPQGKIENIIVAITVAVTSQFSLWNGSWYKAQMCVYYVQYLAAIVLETQTAELDTNEAMSIIDCHSYCHSALLVRTAVASFPIMLIITITIWLSRVQRERNNIRISTGKSVGRSCLTLENVTGSTYINLTWFRIPINFA